MKIYFVRHGKTEWNLEGRFQGYSGDSALLPQSYLELEQLGKHLAAVPFDHVYSSDLQRAHLTAQAIALANSSQQTVKTSSHLREWNFGTLEGSLISTFKKNYAGDAYALKHAPHLFDARKFQAETAHEASRRMIDFVMNLQNNPAKNVLIVSHGAILVLTIRRLLGFPMEQVRARGGLDNASISILETEDFTNFNEVTWNNTDYKQ